jgi:hypothetical protein
VCAQPDFTLAFREAGSGVHGEQRVIELLAGVSVKRGGEYRSPINGITRRTRHTGTLLHYRAGECERTPNERQDA